MADYMPFEIQEEIMKRLPTKSLTQFRSVSKPWKSLIDSPKFIADYSFNHTHQQHLLVSYLVRETRKQRFVSVVDDDPFPQQKFSLPVPIPGLGNTIVLGSSQGLFGLYNNICIGGPSERGRFITKAVIWNPSIRKSVAIDVSYVMVPYSNIVIGFGVCPHTTDPKLVKINSIVNISDMGTMSCSPWQVEVYTLSSGAWRSIPTTSQPRKSIVLFKNSQVVVNEFIYFRALEFDGVVLRLENVIVSFDLTSEEFMEVSLPNTLARAPIRNMVICKLKESLAVVEVAKEPEKLVYDVWMMEHGVSNSFAKLFSINSPDASIQALLGFRQNNEPIFAVETDNDVDDVFVNELHSESINYVGISGKGDAYCARSYMETLLLLDH